MISGDRGRIARDPRRPKSAGGRGWNRRECRIGRAAAAALLILAFLAPAVRAQGQVPPKLEKRFSIFGGTCPCARKAGAKNVRISSAAATARPIRHS